MTLGLIWTIILRFAIQDITIEGDFGIDSKLFYDHRFWLFLRNVGERRFIVVVPT